MHAYFSSSCKFPSAHEVGGGIDLRLRAHHARSHPPTVASTLWQDLTRLALELYRVSLFLQGYSLAVDDDSWLARVPLRPTGSAKSRDLLLRCEVLQLVCQDDGEV